MSALCTLTLSGATHRLASIAEGRRGVDARRTAETRSAPARGGPAMRMHAGSASATGHWVSGRRVAGSGGRTLQLVERDAERDGGPRREAGEDAGHEDEAPAACGAEGVRGGRGAGARGSEVRTQLVYGVDPELEEHCVNGYEAEATEEGCIGGRTFDYDYPEPDRPCLQIECCFTCMLRSRHMDKRDSGHDVQLHKF